MKEKFSKSGEESGQAFSSEALKGLEKGLARAETQLAGAKARLQKALAIGGGEISKTQRASIEYDIKLHEESIASFGSKIKAETERIGEEAGRQFGNRFSTSSLAELEKGLAKAEKDLTETKKRMDSALTKDQKKVIEYDVKVKEESVSSLRSKLKAEAERIGGEMGDGNGRGMMARLASLGRGFVKVGENLAQGVASGFSKLGTFISDNPYLVAGVSAALAVIVPVVGAALTSAVGLALGGGIIAGGIVAAFKSGQINAAIDALRDRAAKTFSNFGSYFVAGTQKAVDTIRGMFDGLDAPLSRIAGRYGPIVAKIGEGIAGMVKNMMPGLERAAMAFAPMLEQLAIELPRVGSALSDMFDSFAKGAPGALNFFKVFMSFAESQLRFIGLLGEGMSKLFDPKFWLGGHAAIKKATTATQELAAAEDLSGEAAKRQATALQQLFDKLEALGLVTLSMHDAQRQFRQSLDDATSALHTNGRTLNDNTAKGRANSAALDQIGKTTYALIDAQRKAHGSQSTLNGTLQVGANRAFDMAMKFGMGAKAALVYTSSIFGIPPSKSTVIAALGLARSLADTRALKNEIDALSGKTVTVTTNYVTRGALGYGRGGVPIGYAHGGAVGAADGGARSGRMWVGEAGPELVTLPPGAQVHTAGDSRRMAMAGNGGGGGGDTYNVTIHTGADPNDVAKALKRFARDNHGIALKGGVRTI